MKLRRVLLLLPAALLLLLVFSYLAAEYWLESAAGRRAIESALSDTAGLPVRLDGDFDIMFLPLPGVRGTSLTALDRGTGEAIATSQLFEAELALGPLLRKELEVNHLKLQKLVLGARGGARFAIPAFGISGFAPGRDTGIEIDLGWLGRVEGSFNWKPAQTRVGLDLTWAAEDRQAIELDGDLQYLPGLVRFDRFAAVIGGQSVGGQGCLLQREQPSLNLELEAGELDLDALVAGLPGGQGAAGGLPLDINLRLRAAALRRGDVLATDTVLEFGAPPACP
ncbi:MAG: hypothetical protein V2I48_02270 [Xanthomonadales bacterium]|jgi:hypothetical protein|nr:hypothetical protein [Xanthomonadales bacterium]